MTLVMMRMRNTVVVLLAVAAAAPAAAQTPAPADSLASGWDAGAGAGMLSPVARRAVPFVYVPNSKDGTVTVIDPLTYHVLRTFATGALPQPVVPSYDLLTLWVANNLGNTLTPIDPANGREGPSVPVADPYNLYFTPDGHWAIVVAERLRRLDFRDAHTMALVESVPVACKGVDPMGFTADGRYAIATCEFSGELLKLELSTRRVVGYLLLDPDGLGARAMPQDIRASPDGHGVYGADRVGGVAAARGLAGGATGETGVGAQAPPPGVAAGVSWV